MSRVWGLGFRFSIRGLSFRLPGYDLRDSVEEEGGPGP